MKSQLDVVPPLVGLAGSPAICQGPRHGRSCVSLSLADLIVWEHFFRRGGEQQASKEWWQRMQVIFHTLDIPVFKLKCINLDDVDLLFHPHIVVGFRSLRSWVSGATQSRCLAGSLGQQMGYILKQTINTL